MERAIKRDVECLELQAESGRMSLDGEMGHPVTVSSLTGQLDGYCLPIRLRENSTDTQDWGEYRGFI